MGEDEAMMDDLIQRLREALCSQIDVYAMSSIELAIARVESDAKTIKQQREDAARYVYLRKSDWACFDQDWLRANDLVDRKGRSGLEWEFALDAAIDAARLK